MDEIVDHRSRVSLSDSPDLDSQQGNIPLVILELQARLEKFDQEPPWANGTSLHRFKRRVFQEPQFDHNPPEGAVAGPARSETPHLLQTGVFVQVENLNEMSSVSIGIGFQAPQAGHLDRVDISLVEDFRPWDIDGAPAFEQAGGADIGLQNSVEGPGNLIVERVIASIGLREPAAVAVESLHFVQLL